MSRPVDACEPRHHKWKRVHVRVSLHPLHQTVAELEGSVPDGYRCEKCTATKVNGKVRYDR